MKRTDITYRKAVSNIRKLYAEIPQVDRDAGVNWYLNAHNEIVRIAASEAWWHYELPPDVACSVVAALSPGCAWKRNLLDFRHLLYWHSSNAVSEFKPQTYSAQAKKAVLILDRFRNRVSGDWSEVLKGPKERAFAQNLAYPEAERELTLDFHAYSIACDVRWTAQSVPQFKVAERAAIDRAYRKVAEENNLKVCQLQAITWEWWRKTRPAPRFQK